MRLPNATQRRWRAPGSQCRACTRARRRNGCGARVYFTERRGNIHARLPRRGPQNQFMLTKTNRGLILASALVHTRFCSYTARQVQQNLYASAPLIGLRATHHHTKSWIFTSQGLTPLVLIPCNGIWTPSTRCVSKTLTSCIGICIEQIPTNANFTPRPSLAHSESSCCY